MKCFCEIKFKIGKYWFMKMCKLYVYIICIYYLYKKGEIEFQYDYDCLKFMIVILFFFKIGYI